MKHFQRIEKYLKGEMPEEERQAFLKEMAEDSELAEEVKIQEFEENALEWMARENLRRKLQAHRKSLKGHSPKGRKGIFRLGDRANFLPIGIAASLLLILAIFFLFPTAPPPGQLADELSRQYPPGSNSLRSDQGLEDGPNSSLDSLYQLGHYLYKEGRYAEAIDQYEAYLDTAPHTFRRVDEVEFYLFLALLKSERLEEATALGEDIVRDSAHRFQPATREALQQLSGNP